jgi:hypothetical protein
MSGTGENFRRRGRGEWGGDWWREGVRERGINEVGGNEANGQAGRMRSRAWEQLPANRLPDRSTPAGGQRTQKLENAPVVRAALTWPHAAKAVVGRYRE